MALTPDEARQLVILTDKIAAMENLNSELLELVRLAGPEGAVDILTHNHDLTAHPELSADLLAELTALLSAHQNLAEAHPSLTAKLLELLTDHDDDDAAHPALTAALARPLADHETDPAAHAPLAAALAQTQADHEEDPAAHPVLAAALTKNLSDHLTDDQAHAPLTTALNRNLSSHNDSEEAHPVLTAQFAGELNAHNTAAGAHPALLSQATANLATHNNDASAHVSLRASAEEAGDSTVVGKFLSPGTLAAARPRLSDDLVLYVRAAGNDNNDGLTSGKALKTIDGALTRLRIIESRGFAAAIDLGSGTWTCPTLNPQSVGDFRRLTIRGQGASSALKGGDGQALRFENLKGDFAVSTLKIIQGATGGLHVSASETVRVTGLTVEVNADDAEIITSSRGALEISGTTTINNPLTKTVASLLRCERGGYLSLSGTLTIVSGLFPVTDAAVWVTDQSLALFSITVNSGQKVNGARYRVANNSTISTNGGGAAYLPGNTDGTAANGGQYV